jgi:uncharacterized protein YukE
MAKINADSEAIRQFVRQLKRFSNDIYGAKRAMKINFKTLSDHWRDPQFKKFADEFEQIMIMIEKFKETSERIEPKLSRLADTIDKTNY